MVSRAREYLENPEIARAEVSAVKASIKGVRKRLNILAIIISVLLIGGCTLLRLDNKNLAETGKMIAFGSLGLGTALATKEFQRLSRLSESRDIWESRVRVAEDFRSAPGTPSKPDYFDSLV